MFSCFTPSVFSFLEEFHQKSLFTNVNLFLHYKHAHVFTEVVANIVPMITSVESIILDGNEILNIFQKERPEITKKLLTSARFLFARSASFSTTNPPH
jgi:hypothetical protein